MGFFLQFFPGNSFVKVPVNVSINFRVFFGYFTKSKSRKIFCRKNEQSTQNKICTKSDLFSPSLSKLSWQKIGTEKMEAEQNCFKQFFAVADVQTVVGFVREKLCHQN